LLSSPEHNTRGKGWVKKGARRFFYPSLLFNLFTILKIQKANIKTTSTSIAIKIFLFDSINLSSFLSQTSQIQSLSVSF
jgi:hypothetical protein